METLFEILAREQSLGEGHARLLYEQGRADSQTYAEGIIAYRFGLPEGLVLSKLVKGLVDTLLALIKSFREADETRRRETLARLDGLKWRPF